MVTAHDADVGENSRLTYNIEAGNEMGVFDIAADSGLITWSQLVNDSWTLCSWTLSVRVTDHGTDVQLWTIASLVVAVDNCVVDEVVHAASRQSVAELPLIDWHVFVVVVAIATCVVIVGMVLTAVVALRHCGGRSQTKMAASSVGDGVSPRDEREGEVMLRLLTGPAPSSDVSSDSVVSSCTDQMLVVHVDEHNAAHQHMSHHALINALQHAHQHHRSLQVLFALDSVVPHV